MKIATGSEKTQIQRELARDNIPTDGASLTLFEKRLRDSREPIGLFALANTLGGFLAVGLLLSIGLVRIDALRRSDLRWPFWVWIAMTLVISWCLLLTKSRTAWIGFFAGLAFGIVQAGYLRLTSRRILGLFAVVVVLAVSVWGLIQAGGLDRQVLTEAPKSLQYRLQYWQATLRLLADHPIWGVGPGQFRNLYLQYKLPEASEEIADPHNLLLDVAANGGLIGLFGLSACILLLLIQSGHRNSSTIDAVSGPQAANASKLFGLLGLLIWIGLFVSGFDDRLLVLLPAMLAVSWCLNRFISAATATSPRNAANPKGTRTTGAAIKESTKPTVLDPAASLRPVLDTAPVTNRAFVIGAAIALTIHLLGAGGIEMPAISLLWLSLVAAAKATDAQHTVQNRPGNFLPALGRMLAPSLVLVALIFSAILPNQRSQGLLSAGDRSIQRGDSGAAAQQYLESANADPFWAEPWRRRAELAFQSAQTSRFQSNETFLKAVNLLQESLNHDPFGHQDERKLSGWWKSKWEMSGDQHDLEEAVTQLQAVSRKYPTNALFLAELALLLNSKGDLEAAREMATRSLAQDEINHRWNHLDRYLPDSIRQQTQGLAGNRSPAE